MDKKTNRLVPSFFKKTFQPGFETPHDWIRLIKEGWLPLIVERHVNALVKGSQEAIDDVNEDAEALFPEVYLSQHLPQFQMTYHFLYSCRGHEKREKKNHFTSSADTAKSHAPFALILCLHSSSGISDSWNPPVSTASKYAAFF